MPLSLGEYLGENFFSVLLSIPLRGFLRAKKIIGLKIFIQDSVLRTGFFSADSLSFLADWRREFCRSRIRLRIS